MHLKQISLSVLTLAVLALAAAAQTTEPAIAVKPASATPVLDGKLDDACWRDAAIITNLCVLGTADPAPVATECRLAFDATRLYFGIRCAESGDHQPAATLQGHVHPGKNDTVELFLAPRQGAGSYYHFLVGAGGAWWEQRFDGKTRDPAWTTGWRCAVKSEPSGWSAEVSIPLYILTDQVQFGDAPLGFNLARTRQLSAPQYLTWAPLKALSFHDPVSFGRLTGLAGHPLQPVCDPQIAEAVAQSYDVVGDRFLYRVALTLVNQGGVAGTASLCLKDCPSDGSGSSVITQSVVIVPSGKQTAVLEMPVTAVGVRTALVACCQGATCDWQPVAAMENLRPLSVFMDRNYYTREAEARVICLAVYDRDQAARGGYSLAVAVADDRGQSVFNTVIQTPDRRSLVSLPIANWPTGTYAVATGLRNKAGKTLFQTALEFQKIPPGPATEVKFDHEKETILVNGQPFFPFGFMLTDDLAEERILQRIAGAGFNTLVRWGGAVGGFTPEKMTNYTAGLDLARKYNLRVFEPALAFGPRISYGMKDIDQAFDATLAGLEQALATWRIHPAVIGYYGLDEPGRDLYPLAEKMYAVCHRLDPYRLVYSSSWNDWPAEAYALFDLLGRHGYYMPVDLQTGTLNKLSRRCAAMAELAAHFHRPFVATPQFCWREEVRKISPHEMRCAYFLPLIRGAKGLIFFIYNDKACHPVEWKAMTEIAPQISRLAPILLEPSPPQNVTCDIRAAAEGAMLPPGPAAIYTDFKPIVQKSTTVELPVIQTLIKNHPGGGEVILAANSEEADRAVTFRLSSIGPKTKVVDFFTGAPVTLKGDTFNARMEGFAVRVWRTQDSARQNVSEAVTMAIQAPAVPAAAETPRPVVNLLPPDVADFESAALAPAWQVAKGTPVSLSRETPYAGQACLAVELIPNQAGSVALGGIALKPETRYRFGAWVRSRITEGKAAAQIQVLVPNRHDTPPRFSLSIPQVQTNWIPVTSGFTTREAVTNLMITLTFPPGRGRVECDAIVLEELGATETRANYLRNASFEEATYFGVPDGWMIRDWGREKDQSQKMYERQVFGDAVHGRACARSGWFLDRYPLGDNVQFQNKAEIDFSRDHVFSVYLKADREALPVKLVFLEITRKPNPIRFETEFKANKTWQRAVLPIPLAAQKQTGTRVGQVSIVSGKKSILFVDAAQLETGLTPTEFKVDDYKALDLGPAYQRAAVLADEGKP